LLPWPGSDFLGNRQSCLRPQFATASKRNIRHLPVVFTEHGALTAANPLNSPCPAAASVGQANSVSVFQHFRFQRFLRARLAEIDKTLLVHDVTLREILQMLRPLLEPPPQPPKPEIGFHVKEGAVRYRVRKKN